MAGWVFCNRCFQPPQGTVCFSLTNCGHVYCDVCLRKGKRDECLICKVPCRTVLLSKRTDSDIQALFMGIDGLCRKYARDTSQAQPPLLAACHLPSEAVWRSGQEPPEAEALPWGSATRPTVLALWPACLEAVVSQPAKTIPSPGRLLSGSDVARSTASPPRPEVGSRAADWAAPPEPSARTPAAPPEGAVPLLRPRSSGRPPGTSAERPCGPAPPRFLSRAGAAAVRRAL
ncbi:hypothetical protein J1605_009216 [Eschrichtius robustus]|uniref:Probable E3 SUMO-protein ligase RNF212 n=1 Tax=Eschrichtius robustus TaxID=9764 RepID=A0AB34GVK4_ESCRO|nr:hypothetical protein J1605_009216 [Eschrichtius robustus]